MRYMVLEKTLPLILLFLMGYFLKTRNILHKGDGPIIGKLLINVVVPAVIINTFSNVHIEQRLFLLPLASFIFLSILLGLSFLIAWLLKLSEKTKKTFIVCFATLEAGSIGYSFMLATFGEIGLSRIVLFDLSNIFFVFVIAYLLATLFGKGKEYFNLRAMTVQLLKAPMIWAPLIGIILNIFHFQSVLLTNFLTTVGSGLLFLVMILLGLEFEPSFSSFKLPILTIIIKTTIGISIGILLTLLFNFTGIDRIAVIVASSLPASILTLVFVTENDLDVKYAANMLSVALLFSILFTTILISFLR